jgi:hypothetical protein
MRDFRAPLNMAARISPADTKFYEDILFKILAFLEYWDPGVIDMKPDTGS